jgi:hypothetical protein
VSLVSVVSAYLASPVIQVRHLAARILAEFLADSPAAIRTMTAAAAAGPSANQIHGQLALLHGLLAGPEPSVAMLEVVKEAVTNMEQWLQHCRHSSFCYLLRWELERIRRQLERRKILVTADLETAEKLSIDEFNMESSEAEQYLHRENVQGSEHAESREGRSDEDRDEVESDQEIEVDGREEDNSGSEESDEDQDMSADEDQEMSDDSDVPLLVSRIHPGFQHFLLDRQLPPEELAKARRSLSHL